MVIIPNTSGYIPAWLAKQIDAFDRKGTWLLVTEPESARARFAEIDPSRTWEKIQHEDGLDLNKDKATKTYDGIVFLFALEHVFNPVAALSWLSDSLAPGGRLFLTTTHCEPETVPHQYHAFPRDYHRFWPDWFVDLGEHVPLNLVAMKLDQTKCIYCVYERI